MSVAINSFVRRQTPESPYTHTKLLDSELLHEVRKGLLNGDYREGYREGVILVEIPAYHFYTGLVKLVDGDVLVGDFKSRRENEEPRKSIYVKRKDIKKQRAVRVQIVCYSHNVLNEDGDAETDADWEIVSLNGYPTEEIAPIDPMTLMHNHFGSDGGTATNMSSKEFEDQMKESFSYWRDKGMLT